MTKLKFIASSSAILGLSAFAVAHAGSPADYFTKYDTNADGVVTEAEFVAVKTASGKVSAADAQTKFTKIAGSDGQLTLAELEAAMETKSKDKGCNKDKSA